MLYVISMIYKNFDKVLAKLMILILMYNFKNIHQLKIVQNEYKMND